MTIITNYQNIKNYKIGDLDYNSILFIKYRTTSEVHSFYGYFQENYFKTVYERIHSCQ